MRVQLSDNRAAVRKTRPDVPVVRPDHQLVTLRVVEVVMGGKGCVSELRPDGGQREASRVNQ